MINWSETEVVFPCILNTVGYFEENKLIKKYQVYLSSNECMGNYNFLLKNVQFQ